MPGTRSSAAARERARPFASRPRKRPRYIEANKRPATWLVNALVDATEISGPARVYSTAFASRAIELPTTLTTDIGCAPAAIEPRRAASVSAVSPDWLIATTAAFRQA